MAEVVAVLVFVAGFVAGLLLMSRWAGARAQEARQQSEALAQQMSDLVRQQEQERAAAVRQREEYLVVQTRLEQAERSAAKLPELEVVLAERQTRIASLEAELTARVREGDEKLQLLQAAREQLSLQFKELAQTIFDEKSKQFSEQNRGHLDLLLNPLKEQLGDFRKKVEETYNVEARERHMLKAELGNLKQLNERLGDEALRLTRALKGDKKLQGNWGEVILSRVLEESGLRRDHEYSVQVSAVDESGQRRQPDVVVHLPENRDIVIDAKVSLVDYEQYVAAEDDAAKEAHLRSHVTALRNHVKGLSEKRYEDLPGIRTLDFVFLFMPVEAAFMLAVDADPSLFREAFDRRIIIVSPTTLLATLRTVESIWRYERQNRNAEEIARIAGGLHDKLVSVVEGLAETGRLMERASKHHEQTLAQLSSGRGNALSQIERLRTLGAKAKKAMPVDALEQALEENGGAAE